MVNEAHEFVCCLKGANSHSIRGIHIFKQCPFGFPWQNSLLDIV